MPSLREFCVAASVLTLIVVALVVENQPRWALALARGVAGAPAAAPRAPAARVLRVGWSGDGRALLSVARGNPGGAGQLLLHDPTGGRPPVAIDVQDPPI